MNILAIPKSILKSFDVGDVGNEPEFNLAVVG